MPQSAVAAIFRALPLAFVLLDAVLAAPTLRPPATTPKDAALAHKGRGGAARNINSVSKGDRNNNANQARNNVDKAPAGEDLRASSTGTRPATTRNPAALARAGRGGPAGDNNTTAVGGGTRGHAGNINNVSKGDRNNKANQARSGEAQVSNVDKDPGGESNPLNDLRSTCSAYTDASCPSGDRVKRGPDWRWGSQDGGDGHGTVQSEDGAGWCDVEWDNGNSNSYRVGYNGAYDLCRLAPGSTGSAGCDKSAFETCADLGNHNYVQGCCQGSCAYGYDDCYFCPASGTGGPHCFKLAASKETACLASSNCAAAAASPSPSPSPSSDTSGAHCRNSVLQGQWRYATLDATSKDSSAVGCQDNYLPLPAGWEISPQDSGAIAVTAAHPWGTHLIVYADGRQRYTLNDDYYDSPGEERTWFCCSDGATALGTSSDGTKYKVNNCFRRILIRAPPSTCTDSGTPTGTPTAPSPPPPPPPPGALTGMGPSTAAASSCVSDSSWEDSDGDSCSHYDNNPRNCGYQDSQVRCCACQTSVSTPCSTPYTDYSCARGARVSRGPHWRWGDQDGGVGGVGTVTGPYDEDRWCKVAWDHGSSNIYRVDSFSMFDLCHAAATKTATHVVKMAVSLSMTKASFSNSMQDLWKKSISAAAGVSAADVKIDKITTISGGRRLLAESIRVDTSVTASSEGAAKTIVQALTADKMNAQLSKNNLPRATFLVAPFLEALDVASPSPSPVPLSQSISSSSADREDDGNSVPLAAILVPILVVLLAMICYIRKRRRAAKKKEQSGVPDVIVVSGGDCGVKCSGVYKLCGKQRNGGPCYSRGGGGAIYYDGVFWKICQSGKGSSEGGWNFSQKGASGHLPIGKWDQSLKMNGEATIDYSTLSLAVSAGGVHSSADIIHVSAVPPTRPGPPGVFYHGTSLEAAMNIQQFGFDVKRSGSNAGAALGRGLYVTTTLQKALNYADRMPCRGVIFELRVDLGRCYTITANDRDNGNLEMWQQMGYDSAWAAEGIIGEREENCIKDPRPPRIMIQNITLGHTGEAKRAGYTVEHGKLRKS